MTKLNSAMLCLCAIMVLPSCAEDTTLASPDAVTTQDATTGQDSGVEVSADAATDPDSNANPDIGASDGAGEDVDADTTPDTTTSDVVADSSDAGHTDAADTSDADVDTAGPSNPDKNGDGELNILVLGTTQAIKSGAPAFAPEAIATELQAILGQDASTSLTINVVAEDLYANATVTTGYGQGGDLYEWLYRRHSLAQYYYWPEGRDERIANLMGDGDHKWDYVVIGGDPYVLAVTPGYYAFGAHKVAAKVAEGGATPLLLMMWSPTPDDSASVDHFAEFTHRTADGAKVDLAVVPAARVWEGLDGAQQDTAEMHPTPHGAYVAAASIYSHIMAQSADESDYTYDDALAQAAFATVTDEATKTHYEGPRTFVSPFKAGGIPDRVLRYNHTGTSSENGILKGLQWVLGKARVTLQKNGPPPINFNYGRANTEFEANKQYKVDPDQFELSLGFPMQDHSNHGDNSMLYGLDGRRYDSENGTDLGAARKMIEQGELPHARAIPIRALYAQMKEASSSWSAYSDGWHMNKDLDKASGAFMYTMLTGHCALGAEPADTTSDQWRQWMAHSIGYRTAWSLMHLSERAPCFKVLPDAPESTFVTTTESAGLAVSFVNPPNATVTVTISTDNSAAVSIEPKTLVFTPSNHGDPQTVTMLGLDGPLSEEAFIVTMTTESGDRAFDGLTERWEYSVIRE